MLDRTKQVECRRWREMTGIRVVVAPRLSFSHGFLKEELQPHVSHLRRLIRRKKIISRHTVFAFEKTILFFLFGCGNEAVR
jgi:hypothetical protein